MLDVVQLGTRLWWSLGGTWPVEAKVVSDGCSVDKNKTLVVASGSVHSLDPPWSSSFPLVLLGYPTQTLLHSGLKTIAQAWFLVLQAATILQDRGGADKLLCRLLPPPPPPREQGPHA